MTKASLGYIAKREANVLAFGLSEMNLVKLIDEHLPIHIRSDTMKLPSPGVDFVVFGAKDQEEIGEQIGIMYPALAGTSKGNVDVLKIADRFYVVPFSQKSGKQLYMIGLDDNSRKLLLEGSQFTFRSRQVGGKDLVPVEVIIFSGKDDEAMEKTLQDLPRE